MKKVQWSKGEWLILLVVTLAFFIRLWPVGYTHVEGHGQEISVLAYRFIHKGVVPLFGYPFFAPSYGHYGPAPVYLFLPFALISTSPLMAVLFSALLSTIAVYVLYRIGRDFWNPQVGWIAALLYATSHFSGMISRRAVIANLAPLFVAVFLYSILALLKERRTLHYVLLFVSTGIILQLHVVEFIVLLLILPVLVLGARINRKSLVMGIGILLLLFLPYLYYEASNGFLETRQRLDLLRATGSAGFPIHQPVGSTFLRSFVSLPSINGETGEQNNPFILNIIDMRGFCQNPPDDSFLMARLFPLADSLSALAWLMFLVLPFLSIGYLVTRRRKSNGFQRKALALMLFWFLTIMVFLSSLPALAPHYLNGLLLSIVILWAVVWGWLIPHLSGHLRPHFKRFILGFVLILALLNTVTWITAHLSNPQKDCIHNAPTLSTMMKVAEVLVRDQRLRVPHDTAENVAPLIDWALRPILFTYNLGEVNPEIAYTVQAAAHQREQRGEPFLNLTGKYMLIQQHLLPFVLDPLSQEITQIGSFLLVRYEPITNTTHWHIVNSEEMSGLEWAQSRGSPQHMPIDACVGGCPPNTAPNEDCFRCLRQSTAYMVGYLGRNTTSKTALVIGDRFGSPYFPGQVSLNGVPLFQNDSLLVPGRGNRKEEILLDITGLLADEQNLLEVLLFVNPEFEPETTLRSHKLNILVFTLSGR